MNNNCDLEVAQLRACTLFIATVLVATLVGAVLWFIAANRHCVKSEVDRHLASNELKKDTTAALNAAQLKTTLMEEQLLRARIELEECKAHCERLERLQNSFENASVAYDTVYDGGEDLEIHGLPVCARRTEDPIASSSRPRASALYSYRNNRSHRHNVARFIMLHNGIKTMSEANFCNRNASSDDQEAVRRMIALDDILDMFEEVLATAARDGVWNGRQLYELQRSIFQLDLLEEVQEAFVVNLFDAVRAGY